MSGARPFNRRRRAVSATAQLATAPGWVIYRGPSAFDGAPIVVIVVRESTNEKTGNMPQAYILRADLHPLDARRTGADASICGSCGLRDGRCYVAIANGPSAVYRALLAGSYPDADPVDVAPLLARRAIRIGAYGDPGAAPLSVWTSLVRHAAGWTGYTHAWRDVASEFKSLVMASCDSPSDFEDARAAGWRTFRVVSGADPVRLPGEAICPASDEAGRKLQCIDCGACDGTARLRGAGIVIRAHGSAVVAGAYRRAGRPIPAVVVTGGAP